MTRRTWRPGSPRSRAPRWRTASVGLGPSPGSSTGSGKAAHLRSPEHPLRRDRRHRLRVDVVLRRSDRDARARRPGVGRTPLHELPHHPALLTDARQPVDRAQPPLRRDGRAGGPGGRAGRGVHEAGGRRNRRGRRVPPCRRLRDRMHREMAPHAVRGDGRRWLLGSVAHRAVVRVRQLLRLHRWLDEPVVSGAVGGRPAGRAPTDARAGLPPERGPGRSGHRVHRRAGGAAHPRAVVPLPGVRSDP